MTITRFCWLSTPIGWPRSSSRIELCAFLNWENLVKRRQVGGDGDEHAEDERDEAEQQDGEEDQQEAQPLQTRPAAGGRCGGLHRGQDSTIGLRCPTHLRWPPRKPPSLRSSAVDSLPQGALAAKLQTARTEGRPLRVKLGIDPTAPDIHLGHAVVLGKLREFQDAGHRVVLIVGDYTARVGDPSGRSSLRPMLSEEEIEANAATFQEQASRILDPDPERLEVRRNSEWLEMAMADLLALVRTTTVAQLLERDDFAKRWQREGADLDARAAVSAAAGL